MFRKQSAYNDRRRFPYSIYQNNTGPPQTAALVYWFGIEPSREFDDVRHARTALADIEQHSIGVRGFDHWLLLRVRVGGTCAGTAAAEAGSSGPIDELIDAAARAAAQAIGHRLIGPPSRERELLDRGH